ncbi:MAG: DnaJ domain-containing protein [Saprospiraceae bacterium]|nr:DnaJ domain-containing protein [Saprospiraceae bacterium]
MTESDARKILGVKDNASPQAIKSAFRRLVKKHHPDMKGGSAVRFREVENAYTLLIKKKKPSFNQSKPKGGTESTSSQNDSSYIKEAVYVFDFGHDHEMIRFRWCDRFYVYNESIYIKKGCFTDQIQSEHYSNLKINITIVRLILNDSYVKESYNTLVYYVKVDLFDFLYGKRIRFPTIRDFPEFKVFDVESDVQSVCYEGRTYHQRIETSFKKKMHNTNVHKIYADVTFDPSSLPLHEKVFYNLWKLKEFLKRKVKPTVK